mmetsp:Transcript_3606/g.10186  ORF Transcript_3606/g.10186 Transcript_3606/m.10186 type:complete len:577 (+) Transcript_3606:195-1925(+)
MDPPSERDFRDYLNEFCIAEEFKKYSTTERAEIRAKFEEYRSRNQKDPIAVDDDAAKTRTSRAKVESNAASASASAPDSGPVDLVDSDDDNCHDERCRNPILKPGDHHLAQETSAAMNEDSGVGTNTQNDEAKEEQSEDKSTSIVPNDSPPSSSKRKLMPLQENIREEDDNKRAFRSNTPAPSAETQISPDDSNDEEGVGEPMYLHWCPRMPSTDNEREHVVKDECVLHDRNVDDDRPTDGSNAGVNVKIEMPIHEPNYAAASLPPEVKREQAEEKLKAAKKQAYEKYADRMLLHRFDGIGLLGGCVQTGFQRPGKKNTRVFDGEKITSGYPVPKMYMHTNLSDDEEYDLDAFGVLTYSSVWQVNGPKFAAQPTAAVDAVPDCMREKNLAIPIFMKRSLTKKTAKTEGKLLGWEYVGNYRCGTDTDLVVWESAQNYPEVSKREIANHILRSADRSSGDTYGREILDSWKDRIDADLTRQQCGEVKTASSKSLGTRARDLGYRTGISDEDLINILVQLDEFHGQEILEFVEYDERIYEFCSKGPTSKNSKGNSKARNGGDVARARDWYNFAVQNMLM